VFTMRTRTSTGLGCWLLLKIGTLKRWGRTKGLG
jgi:hypothetical protein